MNRIVTNVCRFTIFFVILIQWNIPLQGANPPNPTTPEYPTALDTNTTWPAISGSDGVSWEWPEYCRYTVRAIENELGISPSGSYDTVADRLDAGLGAPKVFTVGSSNAQYTTIADAMTAIDALGSGGVDVDNHYVVLIGAGDYAESVRIQTNVSLISQDIWTGINLADASTHRPAVKITGGLSIDANRDAADREGSVCLRGLWITGTYSGKSGAVSVNCDYSANILIDGCAITGDSLKHGIYFEGGSSPADQVCTIKDSIITGGAGTDSGDAKNGIYAAQGGDTRYVILQIINSRIKGGAHPGTGTGPYDGGAAMVVGADVSAMKLEESYFIGGNGLHTGGGGGAGVIVTPVFSGTLDDDLTNGWYWINNCYFQGGDGFYGHDTAATAGVGFYVVGTGRTYATCYDSRFNVQNSFFCPGIVVTSGYSSAVYIDETGSLNPWYAFQFRNCRLYGEPKLNVGETSAGSTYALILDDLGDLDSDNAPSFYFCTLTGGSGTIYGIVDGESNNDYIMNFSQLDAAATGTSSNLLDDDATPPENDTDASAF